MKKANALWAIIWFTNLTWSQLAFGDAGLPVNLTCHQIDGSAGTLTLTASFQPIEMTNGDDVLDVFNISGSADLALDNWDLNQSKTVPVSGAYLPNDGHGQESQFIEFHPTVAAGNDSLRQLVFHLEVEDSSVTQAWVFPINDYNKVLGLKCALTKPLATLPRR